MKSLLMVLFLMGGVAISNADAQNCTPCPPACAAVCKPAASAVANATQTALPGTAAFAACSPEELAACQSKMAACSGKKMSKKEVKDCQVACQPKTAAAAPAVQTQLVAQPASGCKPAPATNTSKQ
jgi:hypothetical protein